MTFTIEQNSSELLSIQKDITAVDTVSCGRYLETSNIDKISKVSSISKKIKNDTIFTKISKLIDAKSLTIYRNVLCIAVVLGVGVKFGNSMLVLHSNINEMKENCYHCDDGENKANWFKHDGYIELNYENPIIWFCALIYYLFASILTAPNLSGGIVFCLLYYYIKKNKKLITTSKKDFVRQLVNAVNTLKSINSLHPMEADILCEVAEIVDMFTFDKSDADYHEMIMKKNYIHDTILQINSDKRRVK